MANLKKCIYRNTFKPHLNKFDTNCYDSITGEEIDCAECTCGCCTSNFPVNTDRNGIGNPQFWSNFQYGDIVADNYDDFVKSVENLGGCVKLTPTDAEGHSSFIEICGLEACDFTIDNMVDKVTTTVNIKTNCSSCTSTVPQCWKDKFIEGGLDNTFTSFKHTNQIYKVTFDNGDVDTFNVASAVDWTTQVQAMATGLGSIMPWAQTVDPFCNRPNGCGGLLGPSVPLNQMVDRYVGFRVCPGDKVPIKIEYTSDQRQTPVKLIVQYVETPTIYIDRCVDCSGKNEWTVDGLPYEPICAIPCGDEFAEIPLALCTVTYTEGCDNIGQTDINQFVPITRSITNCGDGPEVVYLTVEDDGLVEYELIGQFVDCATGETVLEPVPECSDFVIETLYSLEGATGALRMREWDLGPVQIQTATVAFADDYITNTFDENSTPTVTDLAWPSLEVNDVNNSGSEMNLQIVDGYIAVTKPILIRFQSTSLGYFRLDVGECCGEIIEKVIEGASGDGTANPTGEYLLPKGIHYYKAYNFDERANSERRLFVSEDGGATWFRFSRPNILAMSSAKPNEACKKVKICKDSGVFLDLFTDEVIDKVLCYACSLECQSTGLPQSQLDYLIKGIVGKEGEPCPCEGDCSSSYAVLKSDVAGQQFLVEGEVTCNVGDTIIVYNEDCTEDCTGEITEVTISGGNTIMRATCDVTTNQTINCR